MARFLSLAGDCLQDAQLRGSANVYVGHDYVRHAMVALIGIGDIHNNI